MFNAIIFVVLTAFVAFGATLFMATKGMDERGTPVAAASLSNPAPPVEAAAKKPKKNRSRSAGQSPATAKKNLGNSPATPVVAPMMTTPPSYDRRLLM